LREKYSPKLKDNSKDFEIYLETINRQIKDIESLANEFSNFARMPRPIIKEINIIDVVNRSIDFIKMTSKNEINILSKKKILMIKGDIEQLNRVFINLVKNSEEAFLDLSKKNISFKGKIDIEIISNNDYIVIKLTDNGTGISDTKKVMTPYFTTKTKGTGLGLPIVSKIISEHSGDFSIKNRTDGDGVKIEISFPKINA
jgi:two-component system nitrogen regulation sensor histidine kinase NtrY